MVQTRSVGVAVLWYERHLFPSVTTAVIGAG